MQTGKSIVQAPIATKIVSDAFGKVEIPLHPQRIIVLDDHTYLDPVLALGIKPVGIMSCYGCNEDYRGIPDDLVASIPDVGRVLQPSLERIIYLKPDLILSYDFQKNSYPQLSEIAPTIAIDYFSVVNFKERLMYFARLLGKRARAEEILAQYEDRIQQLRQELGKKLENKTVSIIYLSGSQTFTVYKPDDMNHSQILQDAGLQFTQAQISQKQHYLTLNIEALPMYDADYLFIVNNSWTKSDNQTNLSRLKQPIWSTLKAVQNNQVYLVKWDIGGTIGANRVIDDLYKYLVSIP
ncbi:ABC transporter, ferrichrome binding protein [Rivularia sp. IAM M-261]|nr:ABC transporter, ferrichrome binding protein [Rivularia sp. IAM M-261]